jgi:hypothetical protein
MIVRSEPFVNGAKIIQLGEHADYATREVALSFQHANGLPYGTLATGTATIDAMGAGSDQWEEGANSLNLATGQRRWAPFDSAVTQLRVTVANAPADAYCVVTVVNKG